MSEKSKDRIWMVAPPGKPDRELPYSTLIVTVVLVLLPILTLSQITAHWRTDVVDDQMFGYYGWRIAHGATVYEDVWDNKPPGIYWINALGMILGRDSYGGVIAMCVVALIVAHACFWIIAGSVYYRGGAALATVLAGFYLTHGYFQCGTNRTETFLIACEVAAVALYVRGFARDRWWKWYLAGILCGGAFLFKQVGLAAWGAMGLHTIILVCTRDLRFADGLRRCLLLLGGLLTTLAVASAVLLGQGVFGEALNATFFFNRAYMTVGRSKVTGDYVNWFILRQHIWPVLQLPLLMALAAVIHATLWWARPKFRPKEIEAQLEELAPICPRYMLLFGIWYVVAYYGAIVSPHGFRHYVVPNLPPLMLMAGYLINVLRAEQRLLRRFQQRAWVVAAFVAMGYFASDGVIHHFRVLSTVWVERVEQERQADWEIVGEAVARVTEPDDRIQCWGYLPGAYLIARRPNACRYTTTEKIGQVMGEAAHIKEELYETLMSDPPVVFVISAGDYNWLHGITPRGEDVPVDELGIWLDENYKRIADLASVNYYIFKRNDRVEADELP